MRRKHAVLLGLALSVVSPAGAAAQQTRAALIDQARNEFSDEAGMQLLVTALSPELGRPDSLWAVAAYDLAATLMRNDRLQLAGVWLRWAARHGSAWPVDRTWYPPELVTAYEAARAAVEAAPAADGASTQWIWPERFDPVAGGAIEASATDGSLALSIAVQGGQSVPAGTPLTLEPGTHVLIATAEGHEPATVVREVLPGVRTMLEFDMAPMLAAATQADIAGRVVRITYMQGGRQMCGNGFIAAADGLVLTTDRMLGDGTGFQIATADGSRNLGSASIAATDPQRGLAVLRVGSGPAGDPIPRAASIAGGQNAWAVHHGGCTAPTATRTRLAAGAPGGGAIGLTLDLPDHAAGAPLIDRAGMLVGIVRGPTSVMPATAADGVLEQARRDVVAVQVSSPGGGFPWKWVGAGVAVAGVVGLVAGGGGGGDGGGGGPPPVTTGGIIITFPN